MVDRRFKINKTFETKETMFWRKHGLLICTVILGALAGTVLGKVLWEAYHPTIISPKGSGVVIVPEVKADENPFCYDPIDCIRDVGEQMGKTNQEIMTMIRIAKCESGLRPEALGVNRNGSVDRGVLQINSVHKDLSNKDAFDFEKNIRYGWKLQSSQGFRPWVCYQKVK